MNLRSLTWNIRGWSTSSTNLLHGVDIITTLLPSRPAHQSQCIPPRTCHKMCPCHCRIGINLFIFIRIWYIDWLGHTSIARIGWHCRRRRAAPHSCLFVACVGRYVITSSTSAVLFSMKQDLEWKFGDTTDVITIDALNYFAKVFIVKLFIVT